jgi:imidazolonepropionase-like amidohydrolase
MEAYDAIPYNAAIMAAHGVVVSLNSDSDELARRLYWEAAKAMKYGGVSETDALKMVTLNPAWQLGVDKRVGSLEVGKDADIAIFSAHPFDPATRVEMTLVDGIVYFDRAQAAAGAATTSAGSGR